MPRGPVSFNEEEFFLSVERGIDSYLSTHDSHGIPRRITYYMESFRWPKEAPPELLARVAAHIREAYEKAGWGQVLFFPRTPESANACPYFEFVKERPEGTQDEG